MRKILAAILAVVVASVVGVALVGQTVSVNAPIPQPSVHHYVIKDFEYFDYCTCFKIRLESQDVDNNPIDSNVRKVVPDAQYPALTLGTFGNVLFVAGYAGETGGWPRKANTRIICQLMDAGELGTASGLTCNK